MSRTIPTGTQSFVKLREENCFYVDKTFFIKDWWDNKDEVTVILRPRRFGKTLTMSMMEAFFSVDYAGRADLFEGLSIWQHEDYRKLQGTYPVISITLAPIKEKTFSSFMIRFKSLVNDLYNTNSYLVDSDKLSENDKLLFKRINIDMSDSDAINSIQWLSKCLYKYYSKKPLIFLDEYDTPMQEASFYKYWEDMASFTRNLFNASFKSNPYIERALMTGITRVSKESIFSDFNHVRMVTTLSDVYSTAIGFTEAEVFAALDEYGLDNKEEVKFWYDGFIFGKQQDMYNPWSIVSYLRDKEIDIYWANTSTNNIIGEIVAKGKNSLKKSMEILIEGGSIKSDIDESLIYADLGGDDVSAFSLLIAGGYLTGERIGEPWEKHYSLRITNYETIIMFRKLINRWFTKKVCYYNEFIQSMLDGELEEMNAYMNEIALVTFSYFDAGRRSSVEKLPEKFYHGFVLGLMVDLRDRYIITSNRESGFGRYDVMLEPRDKENDDGIIIEFKVRNEKKEATLEETLQVALQQIEDKKYETMLIEKGVPVDRIRKYGFVFDGQKVLIG